MSVFFVLAKLFWWPMRPSNFLAILALIGLFRLWRSSGRKGKTLISLAAGGYLVAVSPLAVLPLAFLENRFPQCQKQDLSQVASIAVLGGVVDTSLSTKFETLSLEMAAERVSYLAELANDSALNNIPLVFSGGSLSIESKLSEADWVKDWLAKIGVPEGRVSFETQAMDTHENAVYIKSQLSGDQAKIAVVTSAFHMPRTVAIFRHQGFDVLPCPVDFRTDWLEVALYFSASQNLNLLDVAAREFVGLVGYRLLGRTSEFLPSQQASS